MADSGSVVVRAKRALRSNDERQLLVLEGSMGRVTAAWRGSADRPLLRVVFETAIVLGQDAPPAGPQPLVEDRARRDDGPDAAIAASPVRVQSWPEVLVSADDLVFDSASPSVSSQHESPSGL
jgi:hypothetical protein